MTSLSRPIKKPDLILGKFQIWLKTPHIRPNTLGQSQDAIQGANLPRPITNMQNIPKKPNWREPNSLNFKGLISISNPEIHVKPSTNQTSNWPYKRNCPPITDGRNIPEKPQTDAILLIGVLILGKIDQSQNTSGTAPIRISQSQTTSRSAPKFKKVCTFAHIGKRV